MRGGFFAGDPHIAICQVASRKESEVRGREKGVYVCVLGGMSGTVISPAIINDPGLIHILCNFLSSGSDPKPNCYF